MRGRSNSGKGFPGNNQSDRFYGRPICQQNRVQQFRKNRRGPNRCQKNRETVICILRALNPKIDKKIKGVGINRSKLAIYKFLDQSVCRSGVDKVDPFC